MIKKHFHWLSKAAVCRCFSVFTRNTCAGVSIYYSTKKRLQHRHFLVNIAKFFRATYFQEHLRMAASALLIKYRASANLFLFKNNVEWFLLRRFVDLVRIYFILIISRNHSSTVKRYIKCYLFWHHNFDKFTEVVPYYLMSILMIC